MTLKDRSATPYAILASSETRMKLDPYCQRQKDSPGSVDFSIVRALIRMMSDP